jgi:quercetin dioxygenase-like cupin family protein
MTHTTPENQQWRTTPYAGIQMCGLRHNDQGGGTVLLKITQGARFPLHDHPGGEEVYVIYGRAVVGGVTVNTGDYLWTPPNGTHDLQAEAETLLFVSAPKGIRLIK